MSGFPPRDVMARNFVQMMFYARNQPREAADDEKVRAIADKVSIALETAIDEAGPSTKAFAGPPEKVGDMPPQEGPPIVPLTEQPPEPPPGPPPTEEKEADRLAG